MLEFPSDQKATCLVTSNLLLTVQVSLHLPYQRNQLEPPTIESEKAIAAGYLQFNWKDGKSNPANILSKHWEFASIWPQLKPLLF